MIASRSVPAAVALALAAAARAEPPLTLDDALAIAARQNPDLALARADADTADADRSASVSGVLPRLDLQSSLGRAFVGRSARVQLNPVTQEILPPSPATDFPAYSLGLQLTQPVFDWRTFQDVSRASSAAQAAERQYDEARLSLAFEVTRRFYEVLRAERSLAVLEKTAARSGDLVGRADALFAAGRAPRSDTFTARVNLGNDRIAVEQQRAVLAQARSALAQVLGRTAGGDLSVVPPATLDAPGVPTAEPPTAEALLDAARARRPALLAQRALVAAADAAVSSAHAGYLPTVDAQASYSRSGSDFAGAGGVYGDLARQYQAAAQLVVSWNLFEGRRTSAEVQRAESQARRARASADKAVEAVAKEIADARAVLASRARQVALAAENLRTADQGLSLARERLDAGLATQLELRDASLKLTQAELSLVESRIDHAVALADLARAAGGPI